MSMPASDRIRPATAADAAGLLLLWALVFDEDDVGPLTTWKEHARGWFARCVEDLTTARFPVIEVDGDVVATAIGTLELGVPNPQCPRGRTVRLANVADRVDLSATPDGQRIYEKAGFNLTKAPNLTWLDSSWYGASRSCSELLALSTKQRPRP